MSTFETSASINPCSDWGLDGKAGFRELLGLGGSSSSLSAPMISAASGALAIGIFTAAIMVAPAAATPAPANPFFAWVPVTQSSAVEATNGAFSGQAPRDAAAIAHMKARYQQLESAVEHLATLDDDSPHYLEPDVAHSNLAFLSFLQSYDVPPPKLFPHGGDTLVLEWSAVDLTRYVTFSDDIARMRVKHNSGQFTLPEKLNVRVEAEAARLIQALGGKLWRVKTSDLLL